MILILPSLGRAGAVLTYHGRIVDSRNNRPLEATNVTFRIRIYSPNPGKCLLYEETRSNVNMAGSQGVFVLPIGDGSGARTGLAPSNLMMEKIFSNNGVTIPDLVCNSGDSYTPQPLDQRQMLVSYDDQSGYVSPSHDGFDDLPLMKLNYVPFAVSAHDAQNLGGAPASSVLRVQGGSATPMSVTNFAELVSLINGNSNQYEKAGKLNGSSVPVLGNGQVLGWNSGAWTAITPLTAATETDPTVKSFAKNNLPSCAANAFLQNDGSGNFACVAIPAGNSGTVTSVSAGPGLISSVAGNAAITSTGTLSVDVGTTAGKIVQLETGAKLPAVDGSQLLNVNATTATTASGLTNTASINTSGTISTSQLTSTDTITSSGNIVSTNGDIVANNGNIQTNKAITAKDGLFLYDQKTPTPGSVGLKAPADVPTNYVMTLPTVQGTNGQVLGMSPTTGQLTWINPSSGSVTSVTADAPLSVDSSNAASPKVKIQQADASHDGYLSQGDFATFSGKANSNDPRFTDSRAPTGLAGGDLGNNYPNPTVEKIKGVAVSATAPTSGQFLVYDGTTQYAPISISGDATMTQTGAVTVDKVGGVTAANIASGANAANAATNLNTVSTIVKRDASGNFAAGTITANLTGNVTGNVTGSASLNVLKTGDTMSGSLTFPANKGNVYTDGTGSKTVTLQGPTTAIGTSYVLRLPTGVPGTSGQALVSDTSGVLSWQPLSSGSVTSVSATLPLSSTGGAAPTISLGGLSSLGTANQILGMNNAGTAYEYKTVNGTTNQVTVANTANNLTLSLPQNIHTGASPAFTGLTLSGMNTAGFVKNDGSGVLSGGNKAALGADVSGVLPIANGGTNSSTVLNNNRVMISSGSAIVEASAITANMALISNASGIPIASSVTNTQLGYLSGVTSSIQTQLDGKITIAQIPANCQINQTLIYQTPSNTWTCANIGNLDAAKITTGTMNRAQLPIANGNTAGSESGILSGVAQAIKGVKTFLNDIIVNGNATISGSLSSASLSLGSSEVKLIPAASTCNSANEGAVKYNKTTKKLEFCNGTTWLAVTLDDPCNAANPAIGTVCNSGTVWLGVLPTTISSSGNNGGKTKYMIMPGGCDGTTNNPVCSGKDNFTKTWNDGTTNYGASGVEAFTTQSQKSTVLGDTNTSTLAAATVPVSGGAYAAAKYCKDMNFGGHTDWYLPSKSELAYIFCKTQGTSLSASYPQEDPNCASYGRESLLSGFDTSAYYWSSTEANNNNAWTQVFISGLNSSYTKPSNGRVRCVRRF